MYVPTKSRTPLTTFRLYLSLGKTDNCISTVEYLRVIGFIKSFTIVSSASVHDGRQSQKSPGWVDHRALKTWKNLLSTRHYII